MRTLAPIIAALALSACAAVPASGPASDMVTVSGEATYRERIALPPGAIMTVRVEDVSRADAPATLLADGAYSFSDRQVPWPFELDVPRDLLDAAVRTSVRVRIEDQDGDLLFVTDTANPVTAEPGQETVEVGTLVLVSARR